MLCVTEQFKLPFTAITVGCGEITGNFFGNVALFNVDDGLDGGGGRVGGGTFEVGGGAISGNLGCAVVGDGCIHVVICVLAGLLGSSV